MRVCNHAAIAGPGREPLLPWVLQTGWAGVAAQFPINRPKPPMNEYILLMHEDALDRAASASNEVLRLKANPY